MTNPRHQQLLDLLPSYALGVLEGEERAELDQHLADGCAECDRELLAWSAEVESLAETVEPVEPSELTRARTLGALPERSEEARAAESAAEAGSDVAVDESPVEPPRPAVGWLLGLAAMIAFAMLSLGALSIIRLQDEVDGLTASHGRLERDLAEARRDLADSEQKLEVMAAASRIVASQGATSVKLAGLEAAPEAYGLTFVDPASRRAVFYAANLETVTSQQTYQLWLLEDGKPASAGLFNVDSQGRATLLVDARTFESIDLDAIGNWAVTIEPAGGVPSPTGPMVLLG